MSTFKRVKVVMLPTNEKASLVLNSHSKPQQWLGIGVLNKNLRKIIATTDSSLIIINNKLDSRDLLHTLILPQPSQSFIEKYIEKYNKGEKIADVMVEYESINSHVLGLIRLKVNPKDNTITIKPIKDSWNREEVIKLMNLSIEQGKYAFDQNNWEDKWIKENL